MKTLSICIPTYNRAQALGRALEHLSKEINGIENEVEICISDNCSPDDTGKVLERWEGLPIVHGRNNENLGYDRNVLAAAALASAEYLWFMGDDDTLTKGAVAKLVKDLDANRNPDMKAVFVNGISKGKWMTDCNFSGFMVFDKGKLGIRPNISFNGCICVRRDAALDVIKGLEVKGGKLFKTRYGDFTLHDFVHSFLFMECLDAGKKIGVAADYGVVVEASGGKMSYRKKLYLELILVKYVLEMKKRYPWFNEAELTVDSPLRVIGRTFIDSGLALDDPSLDYLFQAYFKAISKTMVLEKRRFELAVISVMAWKRSVPVLKQLMLWSFLLIKRILNLPFEKNPENNPVLRMNEDFAIESLPDLTA